MNPGAKPKQTTVTIGQHKLSLRCAPADEERLQQFAKDFEQRIDTLRKKTGSTDRERLTLMAALAAFIEARESQTERASKEISEKNAQNIEALETQIDALLLQTKSADE